MLLAITHSLNIFFKLIIKSILTQDQLLFKVVLTSILIIALYKHYIFAKKQKKDLMFLLEYYKIKNKTDKIYSFTILISYGVIFAGGILALRIYNMERVVNIKDVCQTVDTKLTAKIEYLFHNNIPRFTSKFMQEVASILKDGLI